MRGERQSRLFFGATSAVVTFGLARQFILAISKESGAGAFESTSARIVNFFSFFTVQSNILVAVTTGLLARNLDRRATRFRVLRLDAVICIAVIGVGFIWRSPAFRSSPDGTPSPTPAPYPLADPVRVGLVAARARVAS